MPNDPFDNLDPNPSDPLEDVDDFSDQSTQGPSIKDRFDNAKEKAQDLKDKAGNAKERIDGLKDKFGKAGKKGAEKAGEGAGKAAEKGAEKAAEKTAEKSAEAVAEKGIETAANTALPGVGLAIGALSKISEKTTGMSLPKMIGCIIGVFVLGSLGLILAATLWLLGGTGTSNNNTNTVVPLVGDYAFPLAPDAQYNGGRYTYSDTWQAHRDGSSRWHQGADIMADTGTPAYAVVTGKIIFVGTGSNSGLYFKLEAENGDYFSYMHMDTIDVSEGDEVTVGQKLGTVGYTGNASASAPHIHFEYHPGGGSAVNPFPYLCQWDTNPPSSCP